MDHIIGIDPGTVKCGVAVVDGSGQELWKRVVAREQLLPCLVTLQQQYAAAITVLGNGTASGEIVREMETLGYSDRFGTPVLIDEYGSTEEAQKLYLTLNRRGWRRLWPLGLQTPGRPVDDYVALVLARRYVSYPTI